MIDFSNYNRSLTQYGGSSTNTGIIYENQDYLMKIHDRISKLEKNNPLDESYYRNNIFCEYICCKLLKELFKEEVQDVKIGKYLYKGDNKYRDVIICKNFLKENERLISFNDIVENDIFKNSQYGREKSLSFKNTLFQIKHIESQYNINVFSFFWKQFFYDMFFGNYDRHGENWGFIAKGNSLLKIAPIYDCGSTLCGAIDTEIIKNKLNKMSEWDLYDFLKNESFTAFNKDNSFRKMTYYNFYKECYKYKDYPFIKEELNKIISKINIKEITNFINNLYMESIKDNQEQINQRKLFINKILYIRLNYLLIPLYKKLSNPNLKLLENKIMSQYKYNKSTGKLKEITKDHDNYWEIRKDNLLCGNYREFEETKYNIENKENYCIIYAFDIKSIDKAKLIIKNYLKSGGNKC